MATMTKRAKEWAQDVDNTKKLPIAEAIELVKKHAKAKFTERVDVAIRLGVDPRKSDQMVRGSVTLPNGTGQELKVLVFAKGDNEKAALDAGADYAGGDELANKIKDENWLDFDRVVATPDMMAVVGKISRILGPKGLMPNPKVGTVTQNVAEAVTEIKKGQVQFRTEKGAIIHCTIGLVDFDSVKLIENLQAINDALVRLKPSSAKGTYIKSIAVSSTMGPGVRVDPTQYK